MQRGTFSKSIPLDRHAVRNGNGIQGITIPKCASTYRFQTLRQKHRSHVLAILHSIITNRSDRIPDDNTLDLIGVFIFPWREIPPIPIIVRHLTLAINEEGITLQVPKDIVIHGLIGLGYKDMINISIHTSQYLINAFALFRIAKTHLTCNVHMTGAGINQVNFQNQAL